MGYSEYDLLTHTDPGTPGGDLMRCYWHPVALSEELAIGGPPVPLRVLGEDLVLFRDDQGRPGLLGIHCSHRGADLSYGRLEDGGIRCIYHGWLYDIHGRCLEQPGEPAGSTFHQRIRHAAYPCIERSGAIWAYMGAGEAPLLPNYEFLAVPDEQVFAIKLYHACNWLQGNEGNIDLLHLSFLHHNVHRDAGGNGTGELSITGQGAAPHRERVEAELTDYGLKVCKVRDLGDQQHFYYCTYICPCAFAFSSNTANAGYSVNWHVPIDDTHHWKYTFIHSRTHSLDKEMTRRTRLAMDAQYRPLRNKTNRYQQDRDTMRTACYSGIGLVFQAQDMCVVEGPGPIQDRSQEHLTAQDAAVVASRKLLLKGLKDIAEGRDPLGVIRQPDQNRFPKMFAYTVLAPARVDWRTYMRDIETEIGTVVDSPFQGRGERPV